MKTTSELYCQYLLSSQVNYTCTNLADHFAGLTHDDVSRFQGEPPYAQAAVGSGQKSDYQQIGGVFYF